MQPNEPRVVKESKAETLFTTDFKNELKRSMQIRIWSKQISVSVWNRGAGCFKIYKLFLITV